MCWYEYVLYDGMWCGGMVVWRYGGVVCRGRCVVWGPGGCATAPLLLAPLPRAYPAHSLSGFLSCSPSELYIPGPSVCSSVLRQLANPAFNMSGVSRFQMYLTTCDDGNDTVPQLQKVTGALPLMQVVSYFTCQQYCFILYKNS